VKTTLLSLAGAAILGAGALAITPAAAAPLSPAPLGNAVDQTSIGFEEARHRRHRRYWRRHHFWPWWGYHGCFYSRRGRLICHY
jgi:hypothetical protein